MEEEEAEEYYLHIGMLVVEEEWEREVRGGGGIPVLREVWGLKCEGGGEGSQSTGEMHFREKNKAGFENS